MPELTVIAGPNGAGKSTLSAALVDFGVPVFDGDKELQKLQQSFPDIDAAILMDLVNDRVFVDAKKEALASRHDFAFETNFNSPGVMDSVCAFKAAGYKTRLFYLGLPKVEDAVLRVNLRVRKGGHYVSADNIRANFFQGYANFIRYHRDFDEALVLYNGIGSEPSVRLRSFVSFESGRVARQEQQLPEWVLAMLKQMKAQTSSSKTLSRR